MHGFSLTFSARGLLGFHRRAKLLELIFFLKNNFPLDTQTKQAKILPLQLVNFPSVQPLINKTPAKIMYSTLFELTSDNFCPFCRIVRAFLIEEQKIVVRVLKAQQGKKPASD